MIHARFMSVILLPLLASGLLANGLPGRAPHAANPLLPGYYADPSILQDGGKAYIYATIDPWGGRSLGCWESADWKNWVFRELNWPTKQACTSPSSKGSMVWAPSVLKGTDGKFHMVVSVGSEVWAGVADHPLGPWKNALGGKPLIPGDFRPGFHMIDAELFLDEDGQAYLYWGSGLDWKNGRCWAVKLKPDMATLDGEVHDVTPPNYFEAPFMVRRGGRYYLMYSAGNTTGTSYRVHYAAGDSPFGPFTEGTTSPILVTDERNGILSPGHHAVFSKDGETFILYHRHSIPFDPKFVGRQVCADRLVFSGDGTIARVVPSHEGPPFAQGRASGALAVTASASSQESPLHGPACAADDNYATRWAAAKGDVNPWIQLDLGSVKEITRQEIRPEYAWKPCRFIIQASGDGNHWTPVGTNFVTGSVVASPFVMDTAKHPLKARYLRLQFPETGKGEAPPSLWEWSVY